MFLSNHLPRSADHRAVRGDVASYNGIRADNRVVTNLNAFQNDGVDTQPAIMLDQHRQSTKFVTLRCSFALLANNMIGVGYENPWSNQYVVLNLDRSRRIALEIMENSAIRADFYLWLGSGSRWLEISQAPVIRKRRMVANTYRLRINDNSAFSDDRTGAKRVEPPTPKRARPCQTPQSRQMPNHTFMRGLLENPKDASHYLPTILSVYSRKNLRAPQTRSVHCLPFGAMRSEANQGLATTCTFRGVVGKSKIDRLCNCTFASRPTTTS